MAAAEVLHAAAVDGLFGVVDGVYEDAIRPVKSLVVPRGPAKPQDGLQLLFS